MLLHQLPEFQIGLGTIAARTGNLLSPQVCIQICLCFEATKLNTEHVMLETNSVFSQQLIHPNGSSYLIFIRKFYII